MKENVEETLLKIHPPHRQRTADTCQEQKAKALWRTRRGVTVYQLWIQSEAIPFGELATHIGKQVVKKQMTRDPGARGQLPLGTRVPTAPVEVLPSTR